MEIKLEQLHKQAVNAALQSDWQKSILIHKKILNLDPENLDSHLGIAFAYMQIGDLPEAKKYYKEALIIEPISSIARNNLDKINILIKKGDVPAKMTKNEISFNPDTFLHTEGKTKDVDLVNIGQADVLAKLKTGQIVELKIKKRRVEVRTKDDEYIGCLSDDLSKRLIFFLEAKSKYAVYVKSATKNSVELFIKEEKKGTKVKNFVSFPDNIQDDLKFIIGKSQDHDDDNEDDEDGENYDDDLDEDEMVDDIEELAEQAQKHKEEEYLSQIVESHSDDDDDYED